MSGHRTAADLIADIMAQLSRLGVAVFEVSRTGYGLHLWMVARPPGEGVDIRLYVLRRRRGRWSVDPRSRDVPFASVPDVMLQAARREATQ